MTSDSTLSTFPRIQVAGAPLVPTDVVRLTDLNSAISATAPLGHTHLAAAITDFADAWRARAAADLEDSDNIQWSAGSAVLGGTNPKRKGLVKLKAGGGLKSSAAGVEIDFGPSGTQAAAGNHTHAQLHDAMTALDGQSIHFSLSVQALSGEVRLRTGSGLAIDTNGLGCDFGPGATQVAAGNHSHALLHLPAAGANTNSVAVTVDGSQNVSATVRRKSGGAILEDSSGLYLDVGPSGTQVAAGNHTHPLATTAADGLLAAADKVKLDAYGQMIQVDLCVPFTRHDFGKAGVYVGGKYRWGQAMQVVRWHATAEAPVGAPTVLGLELDGTIVDTLSLGAGTSGVEVFNSSVLSGLQNIAADKFARIKVMSGTGTIENEASRFNVMVEVRPSLATAPTVRLNSGGGLVAPFSADGNYDGGSTASTTHSINLGLVTNPAPEAVYQTNRNRTDTTVLNYVVSGLAKGLDHKVRCHFADFTNTAAGQQVFDVVMVGAVTATTPNFDILDVLTGLRYTAYIIEVPLKPDANGQITISLIKRVGGVQINAVEIVPIV